MIVFYIQLYLLMFVKSVPFLQKDYPLLETVTEHISVNTFSADQVALKIKEKRKGTEAS